MPYQQLNLLDCSGPSPSWEQVAGIDEVGRGALFGPVVAAAVMLSGDDLAQLQHQGLTDSKRLSAAQRQRLARAIQQQAIACAIGLASVREIDRFNILQASLLAMGRAVQRLSPAPVLCLVDGNQAIPHLAIPQRTLVQGDRTCLAIAAASIVAKVWRDTLITRLDAKYPGYGLANHKGYGTAGHRQAIQTLGISAQHRRSFRPCQVGNGATPAANQNLVGR
jgi:ribonuclease HII